MLKFAGIHVSMPRNQGGKPCPGWTPTASAFTSSLAARAVGRAAARDGRHARQLGRHLSRPERALPHAALRPARLRTVRKGAPADHHGNPGGRPRGRAAGKRAPAALPFRYGRRRHDAGAHLHDQISRSRCELRVLQSVHRRRSDPRGRARAARRSRRARGPAQGHSDDARQLVAARYRRPRRPTRPIAGAILRTIRSASPP